MLTRKQFAEAGIPIGVQGAVEGLQVPLRMHALAIRRIGKPHRRCAVAVGGAFITHIGPQPCGLRAATSGCEYRHWGVIGVQRRAGEHMTADRLDQGLQQG